MQEKGVVYINLKKALDKVPSEMLQLTMKKIATEESITRVVMLM